MSGPAAWTLMLGQMVYYHLPEHADPAERSKRRVGQISMLGLRQVLTLQGAHSHQSSPTNLQWVPIVTAGAVGLAHVRVYNQDHLPALTGGCPQYIVLSFAELVPLAVVL